jgi:non-specific serine/threonine protein kinase
MLTKENIHTIVQICHRVDAIPLAIELAAARVNILNVEQILKQLKDSFSILAGGGRIGIQRHQTLRTSMDWSWGLLSEEEQIFLQQLSIFAGGWTLEAAQAVCDGDVLRLTGSLVNKSLIAVDREEGRETRYRFHEIVRQYAREKLNDSGEGSRLQDRHAPYYLDVAEECEAIMYDNALQAADRLRRIDVDLANIRAALSWTLDESTPEKGIRAAQALTEYWNMRGLLGEGRAWLEKALSRVDPTEPSFPLSGLLLRLGQIIHQSNSDEEKAYEYIAQSRGMYQNLGDHLGYARATLQLARITMLRYEKSVYVKMKEEYYAEITAIFKELRAEGDLASALFEWGCLRLFECEDFKGALSLLAEAESLYRKLGSWYIGAVEGILACAYWRLGQPERARELFKRALATLRAVDDYYSLMMHLSFQGEMEMELASDSVGLDRADSILLEDLKIARKFGSKSVFIAHISALLGNVAQQQGRYSLAIERFREALLILQEMGLNSWGNNPPDITSRCLLGLAEARASLDQAVFSARVLGAVQRLWGSDVDFWEIIMRQGFERVTALVRSPLDEASFQSAWNAGQAMSLDEALSYTLKELEQ